MKTGEGKTFVATQPLYLNALAGTGVHLVTVNDYLAKRDAEWTRPSTSALGMRVALHPEHDAVDRAQGRVRGRHHLRHELRVRLRLPARQHGRPRSRRLVQRSHAYAIVDEVDSILIDEARTPLIISGEPETAAKIYYDFARDREDARGRAARPTSRRASSPTPTTSSTRSTRPSRRRERGDRQGRARAQDREPLRPAQRAARQPPDPVAEGPGALQARRRLRRRGRRGEDRRRVHRPDHGGPPLVARASTRRSRRRRACESRRSTSRSRRSRSRTTSASTRSSPA